MIVLDETKLSNSALRVILLECGTDVDILSLDRNRIESEIDRLGLRYNERGQREKIHPVDDAMTMTLGEFIEAINGYKNLFGEV